ncbi:hypothetical protein FRB96_002996 [Tulasnella sp. 330]|nr:hypothetical protein FRB96_002996 [Tulasnella sp. 330]
MSNPTDPSSSIDKPIQVKLVLLGKSTQTNRIDRSLDPNEVAAMRTGGWYHPGEAAVGKSSVVLRFVSNEFQANKEPTIGAAFLTQKCRLEDRVLRYEIWDTAGQERFHSLAPMYYRNAQAAVVVYDVTKATSLEKAKSWVKELQRQANPNIVIALAGNKVDLVQAAVAPSSGTASTAASTAVESEDEEADDATATPGETEDDETLGGAEGLRAVPKEEAQAYASEAGLLFFETSAKTGEGIVEVFTEIG